MEHASTPSTSVQDRPWMNRSLPSDKRANLLLSQMTLEEKIDMLSEKGEAGGIPSRLGIPVLTFTDGPAGVRINRSRHDVNEGKATALPAPIALAATWNRQTAQRYGDVIGLEAWSTGHNVLFGPGLDIVRIPFFGRMFESMGEDPVLTGLMATYYIQGLQRHAVLATAKHYNVNAQEEHRLEADVHIDERTLQEIYTLPFAAAVRDGHVGAVMGAYNKINGIYCCEHPHLLNEILKQQLGFTGWVVSDFQATHSTVEAANAGLDLELAMRPAKYFGDALLQAVQQGQVSQSIIDEKVFRILSTMFTFGLFDSPPQLSPLPIEEHTRAAREIASESIVLLKNAGEFLPLSNSRLRSVAVIGAGADSYITGGGSALVQPTSCISILEGIRRRVSSGVHVEYAEGTDPVSPADLLPGPELVPSSVLTPPDADAELHGLCAQYWTNTHFEGEPELVRTDRQVALNLGFFNFFDQSAASLPVTPHSLNNAISVRWTGYLNLPMAGDYTLSLTHLGTARLFIDSQPLIDNPGITLGTQSVTCSLLADQAYTLCIEYAADRPEQSASLSGMPDMMSLTGGKMRFGWQHPADMLPPRMQEAVTLAKQSDVAIVVVRDYNSEHADRPSLTLPNDQDRLVQAVAAANPRTVVVVASGGPVLMPWLDQVPAVLECWYGGQEVGNALADVLFGDLTPSGKLPITFPRSEAETPISSPEQYSPTTRESHFSEELAVGYRGYDQLDIEPLFPFGYGLSYTSFSYTHLRIEPDTSDSSTPIQVCFSITNTGSRVGAEIAQVYLALPASTAEPPKRLVGWAKVALQPDESKEVTVTLDPNATSRPLSYWNTGTKNWQIADGTYQVQVAASSRDIRLTGEVHIKQ
jgi:beta-glucosidase